MNYMISAQLRLELRAASKFIVFIDGKPPEVQNIQLHVISRVAFSLVK